MTKVVQLHDRRRNREIEDKFIDLLDREVKVEGNVKPLSTSLLDRMNALRHKAEQAKARAEILEG
ncbi:hypothetical protein R7Q48_07985 [Vibrio sp. 378]|uniref:hypothetical protein n=1 Tax=Vibrio TaxID=662 RepID=UPI00111D594A|nr:MULTISPECIES: hypothetical protein [Vibrio]EGQ8054737.1 hypothetical protein [Vibrio alginolyticus]ELA7326133.1 hypothetical protein [Vibrio alginolyticus]MCS0179269.1 hypothetical protein [Vibrio alginolyticus]MDF4586020.1 hypothetical protein [Vibrio parahaemolyticus]MDF4713949.1 hypothetical protein [Vibrio parahaemolyticus]